MKKILSICSASLIAIATLGHLILHQYFDNKIYVLEKKNKIIIQNQKAAAENIYKANTEVQYVNMSKDLFDIFQSVNRNNYKLNIKKELIMHSLEAVSLHAISASLSAKQITQEIYDKETDKLSAYEKYENFDDFYRKYMLLAAKGTLILKEKAKQNNDMINKLKQQKNIFWLINFALQSSGLLIGIWIIGIKSDR